MFRESFGRCIAEPALRGRKKLKAERSPPTFLSDHILLKRPRRDAVWVVFFSPRFSVGVRSSEAGDKCASRRYCEAEETESDQAMMAAASGEMPHSARGATLRFVRSL